MIEKIKSLIESHRLVIDGTYTVENGEINVVGNVKLRGLAQIPIKFGTVDGDFNCSFCGLTTLSNLPHTITGSLLAAHNKFIDLTGCSKNIGENIIMNSNKFLMNLVGCPANVNGILDFYNCNIANLHGIAKNVEKDLMLGKNKLGNLSYFPDKVGGSADLTDNFILTIDNIIDKVVDDINSDNNPCNAADGIEENRLW